MRVKIPPQLILRLSRLFFKKPPMSSARYQSAQSQPKCNNRLKNNRRIILENCTLVSTFFARAIFLLFSAMTTDSNIKDS